MKKCIGLICFLVVAFYANAQMKPLKQKQAMTEIADKLAIKEVVDRFSILADTKEVDKQVLLFTENATVETFINGKSTGVISGRKQIGEAFSGFLNRFETVYHLNGQQVVNIEGNTAKATSYCLVVLIANDNGKKTKTTFGIYYNDDFAKQNNVWLITKRKSNFTWQTVEPLNN